MGFTPSNYPLLLSLLNLTVIASRRHDNPGSGVLWRAEIASGLAPLAKTEGRSLRARGVAISVENTHIPCSATHLTELAHIGRLDFCIRLCLNR